MAYNGWNNWLFNLYYRFFPVVDSIHWHCRRYGHEYKADAHTSTFDKELGSYRATQICIWCHLGEGL